MYEYSFEELLPYMCRPNKWSDQYTNMVSKKLMERKPAEDIAGNYSIGRLNSYCNRCGLPTPEQLNMAENVYRQLKNGVTKESDIMSQLGETTVDRCRNALKLIKRAITRIENEKAETKIGLPQEPQQTVARPVESSTKKDAATLLKELEELQRRYSDGERLSEEEKDNALGDFIVFTEMNTQSLENGQESINVSFEVIEMIISIYRERPNELNKKTVWPILLNAYRTAGIEGTRSASRSLKAILDEIERDDSYPGTKKRFKKLKEAIDGFEKQIAPGEQSESKANENRGKFDPDPMNL